MIEELKIQNFRCFSEVEINGIKPITVISGKNNIGKSSVLEALFFMYDHANGTPFLKMNRVRGEAVNRSIYNTWESVFHNANTDKPIIIEMAKGGKRHVLKYEKESTALIDFSKEIDKNLQTVDFLSNMSSYALKMTYEKETYKEETDYVFVAGVEQTQLAREVSHKKNGKRVPREALENLTYLANSNNRDDANIIDLFSKLEMRNGKDKLIPILRLIDNEIDDISVLTSNGVVQLYVKKNGVSMPFRYSGDGIIKLMGIALRILADPGCVLLIDEIENGLHYSVLEEMWSVISEIAKDNNCQIIATTHSYEAISALSKGAGNADRKDDFSYIRLERVGDVITTSVYDYEDMEEALGAEIEVR